MADDATRCPCLSGESYGACCGRIHRGEADAATAEQLMRSRFSAFAVGDAAYLLRSWHSSTRPPELELDDEMRWYRLDINGSTRGGMLDNEGTVDFTAFYRDADGRGSQQENSNFVRENGRWVYLD